MLCAVFCAVASAVSTQVPGPHAAPASAAAPAPSLEVEPHPAPTSRTNIETGAAGLAARKRQPPYADRTTPESTEQRRGSRGGTAIAHGSASDASVTASRRNIPSTTDCRRAPMPGNPRPCCPVCTTSCRWRRNRSSSCTNACGAYEARGPSSTLRVTCIAQAGTRLFCASTCGRSMPPGATAVPSTYGK